MRRLPVASWVERLGWLDARRLIDEANALLLRAAERRSAGRFQLEAAIQSAHADRRRLGVPDWIAIERLYAQLERITNSAVVTVNRALVIANLASAEAGLAMLDDLTAVARLLSYQPYWVARATLLKRAGDIDGARLAYDHATALAPDERTRRHLEARRP